MRPEKIIEVLRGKLPERLKLKQKFISIIGGADPSSDSGIYEDLAYVYLAMDDIYKAHENYKKSVLFMLEIGKPLQEIAPNMVNSPSLGWPWELYLGLPLEQCQEQFKLIISETEKQYAPFGKYLSKIQTDTYLTKTSLAILSYLVGTPMSSNRHLLDILYQTKRYQNIDINKVEKRTLFKKFEFHFSLSVGKMVKGLYDNNIDEICKGANIKSDIHARFIKTTDDPESIADHRLIILYDQAKTKWPDFYVETPFIPKSILEKGYWNQIG